MIISKHLFGIQRCSAYHIRRFSSFLRSDKPSESQSDMLSNTDNIFELQLHEIKPQALSDYLTDYATFVEHLSTAGGESVLLGSWTCEIGHQGRVYHLWKYPGGYPCLMNHMELCRSHKNLMDSVQRRDQMLYSRRNQICLAFSFWPEPTPRRSEHNIYELRSYSLRLLVISDHGWYLCTYWVPIPADNSSHWDSAATALITLHAFQSVPGTMIEFGNHWVRGLRIRAKNREPVAGLFAHIGDLHIVHHFWAYADLEARRKSRDEAWQHPGWSACVMNTVPLVHRMSSNILRPTSFSPLQ